LETESGDNVTHVFCKIDTTQVQLRLLHIAHTSVFHSICDFWISV